MRSFSAFPFKRHAFPYIVNDIIHLALSITYEGLIVPELFGLRTVIIDASAIFIKTVREYSAGHRPIRINSALVVFQENALTVNEY